MDGLTHTHDVLIVTPAGALYCHSKFFFRRVSRFGTKTGWVTARSVDQHGRWVNGTDERGLARSIEIEHITRIVPTRTRAIIGSPIKPPLNNRKTTHQ